MRHRRHLLTVLVGLPVFGPLPTAAGQDASPSAAATTKVEIALLAFIGGGGPLSPVERERTAAMAAAQTRSNPQRWAALSRGGQAVLQRLSAGRDPVYAATVREDSRAAAAFPPPGDALRGMESEVIGAHDPVVAGDPRRRRVVTEQSLLAIRRAVIMTAARLNLPPPGPGFLNEERTRLGRDFAGMDDKTQNAYAHVARNAATTEAFLTHGVNAGKIAAYFSLARQQMEGRPSQALTDYAVVQLLPAGYTVYSRRAARAGGAAGAEALQLRWMQMKRAQQAVICAPGAHSGLCDPLP